MSGAVARTPIELPFGFGSETWFRSSFSEKLRDLRNPIVLTTTSTDFTQAQSCD
jgi:hypothetical protein